MAEILMMVGDPALAREVEAVAGAAEVPVATDVGPGTTLVVVDAGGLSRLGAATADRPVVFVARDPDEQTWRDAAAHGLDQVVALPGGAPLLDARLRSAAAARGPGLLIRVIGVRGGAGATTLAVGLAYACAQQRRHGTGVVLVDGDRHGPGIATVLGLPEDGGIRWSALADIRGRMPAAALAGRLPGRDGVRTLSHACGDPVGRQAWSPVVGSLVAGGVTAVADVPSHALEAHPAVGQTRDVVVLPRDVGGIRCARTLMRDGLLATDPVVVVRDVRGPVEHGAVRSAFDGCPLVVLPHCRGVVGAADFGDLADAVMRGAYRRICGDVLAHLTRPMAARRGAR